MPKILVNAMVVLCFLRCVLYLYTPETILLWVSTGDFLHQFLISGVALMPSIPPIGRFSIITLTGIKECYYLVNIPGCQKVTFDPPLYDPRRPSLNCTDGKTWINGKTEGELLFDEIQLKKHNITECGFHTLHIKDGLLRVDPKFHRLKDSVNDDFVLVRCLQDEQVVYEEFFPFIRRKPKVSQSLRSHSSIDALSVIMIGMDATPKSSYFLNMKKTLRYIQESETYVELQGILRSGPSLLPNLLTSLTGTNTLDVQSNATQNAFIWKEFSKAGYKTLLIDADPVSSVFQKSRIIFDELPTDYYLPPLDKDFIDGSSSWTGGCVNKGFKSSTILRYAEDFIDAYVDQPVFALVLLNGLTEDGYSAAEYHDKYVRQFLQNLKMKQHMLHSIVMLFGESNHHFPMQVSAHSQDDEEIPFFIAILPPWFPHKYPERFAHLQSNQHIITSAFDVHETLRDILRLRGWVQTQDKWGPGRSLMLPIQNSRNCMQAGIEDYWCTCIGWEDITTLTDHVGEAAIESVEAINVVGSGQGVVESLDAVLEAKRYLPKTGYALTRSHPGLIQIIFRVLPTNDVFLSVISIYEENQGFKYELKHLDLLINGF